MNQQETIEKIAEITYNAARCLSRQEAIDTAQALYDAGYRKAPLAADEKKVMGE